jgi:type I restriction enzyme S subunit
MSFPRYPKYKDSRVEWLGEVPVHWDLRPLWTMFRRVKRVDFENEELLSVYRDFGVIPKSSRDDNFNKPSEDLSAYQLVERGDLVINKMKAWQGSVAISNYRGIVSPAYYTYNATHKQDAIYLHFLMRSLRYITGYLAASKGIRVNQWDLEPQLHSRMPLVLPPLAEQHAIASFLDRETAKIDALIAEQQRLIELLQEKRQAVISHAVTKGLNPDAPMKDSGIEWLGQVPAHWDVARVKDYFITCSGGTPNTAKQDLYYTEGGDGYPWVRTTDLNNDRVSSVPIYITEQAVSDSACSLLPPGTVMVAMYGGDGTVGKNGLLTFHATINQAVCGLLPSSFYSCDFIFRYMQFYRPYWMIGAESSRKDPNISQDRVRNAPVVRPPIEEQKLIAEFIEQQIDVFNRLQTAAESSISLLQERRSALISAAVTGQIDVRGLAPKEAA